MTIVAAADGSSLGNPGQTGWCWYINDSCWAAGGWDQGTNNQGELTAVLKLLQATSDQDEELLILADSQYVINSLTKWRHNWKQKNWTRGKGKPIENLELMQSLDRALSGRKVSFQWVKGHAGNPMNEAADTHARAFATALQEGSQPQAGPGFDPQQKATCTPPKGKLISADASQGPATLFDEPSAKAVQPLESDVEKVRQLIAAGVRPGTAVEIVAQWFGLDSGVLRDQCRSRITLG